MVEPQPSKLMTRVRFSLPALLRATYNLSDFSTESIENFPQVVRSKLGDPENTSFDLIFKWK